MQNHIKDYIFKVNCLKLLLVYIVALRYTHIFESIFAKLAKKTQEAERHKPCPPEYNFVHVLYVQNPKNEDKFVKNKIPELVFQMLAL